MEFKPLLLFIDPVVAPDVLKPALQTKFRLSDAMPAEALSDLAVQNPDAILINARADVEGGAHLCRSMRMALHNPAIPIVVMAEADQPSVRIAYFKAGADDYFALPADPEELCARVEARISRLREAQERRISNHVIEVGRLRLDLERVEMRIGEGRVPLGPVEFKILSILVRGLGQLRSREDIETFVWGENRPASRALDPHINALRKKLQGSDLELRTVYGAGYSLRRLEASPKVV
ncbi:MAG: response regulator transcription factor [Bdellovibrionales bacterium]|nr:response regulator transcription factor [Bdellovibrionales bacterium]